MQTRLRFGLDIGYHSILLVFAACALFGQQPPDNSAGSANTIRLNVRQVLVPVIVADKKGHPTQGLRKSDFQVTEDGVPQEIVSFTKEAVKSGSVTGSLPSTSPQDVPKSAKGLSASTSPGRGMMVICFDTLHTSGASFGRARASVDQLFGKGGETGDQFVLLSLGRQLRVIQPATNDPSVIRAKLGSKEFTSALGDSETAQLVNALHDVKSRMDTYCTGCPCGRDASNRKSTCDVERQEIARDLDARADQFRMYSTAFFAGLKRVVEELAKLDGRRTLVLVSDGFTLTPGKELYAIASAYLPNSPYFKFDPSHNMQPALDESLRVAAARDIVVSTIEARGIYSPSSSPGGLSDASNAAPGATGRQEMLASRQTTNAARGGSLLEEVDSKWSSVEHDNGSVLAQLAKATGGIYFHDSNDLVKGFREIVDDRSEVYIIAYTRQNAADGKFHQITVTVNAAGLKPGNLIVRSKAGYWADPAHP
jgi:VWFA-related protein